MSDHHPGLPGYMSLPYMSPGFEIETISQSSPKKLFLFNKLYYTLSTPTIETALFPIVRIEVSLW